MGLIRKVFDLRDWPMNGLENVGEDRADHEVDLVALQQALDLGHRRIRLELVVDHDDLDIAAAHLAAEILHRERKAVADLLAKRGGGSRQGYDHTQLDLLLRERRIQSEQQRQSCQRQLLLHDLSPMTLALNVASSCDPTKLSPMTASAASKPKPAHLALRHHATGICKLRANYLKPKEIRVRSIVAALDLRPALNLFEAQNVRESVPAPMPAVSDCIEMLDSETKAVETPEDHAEELRLWLRLLTCTTLIEGEVRGRLRQRFDVTLPRFDLMAQLDKAPDGMTLSDVSKRMMVSNGNVTGLVERLVESGHLDRRTSETDRRVQVIRLTKLGRAEFRRMAAEHETWIADLFADLTPKDVRELMRLLAKTKASAQKSAGRRRA